jgi:hypothetical protein
MRSASGRVQVGSKEEKMNKVVRRDHMNKVVRRDHINKVETTTRIESERKGERIPHDDMCGIRYERHRGLPYNRPELWGPEPEEPCEVKYGQSRARWEPRE